MARDLPKWLELLQIAAALGWPVGVRGGCDADGTNIPSGGESWWRDLSGEMRAGYEGDETDGLLRTLRWAAARRDPGPPFTWKARAEKAATAMLQLDDILEWLDAGIADWHKADDANSDEYRYQALSVMSCAADELMDVAREVMLHLCPAPARERDALKRGRKPIGLRLTGISRYRKSVTPHCQPRWLRNRRRPEDANDYQRYDIEKWGTTKIVVIVACQAVRR